MWSVKTETESRWKEIEGKSRDVFQCFNAGQKYVGNNKQEGKGNQQYRGRPAGQHPGKQLLSGRLWGLPSKGLGRKLLSCLNIPAVCGSLPFLLQSFTDPEVNEVARSSIRDSCVVLMIPDADITKPVTGGDWSWLETHQSLTETPEQMGKWKSGTSRTKNKPRLGAQQVVQGGEKATP